MKVLITLPHLNMEGGVANYFRTIRKYFSFEVEYFHVGAVNAVEAGLEKIGHLITDALRLRRLLECSRNEYDLIHLNPSFNFGSLIRDAILLRLANSYGKKTLVFFRGFNLNNVKIVDEYFRKLFFSSYNKADSFVLLGMEFEAQLRKWGFDQPIYLETTLVDDELVKSFSLEDKIMKIMNDQEIRLLFLSRIVKEKGIMETLQAFKMLSEKFSNIYLTIAGDGPYIAQTRRFAESMGLSERISFPGYVTGDQKKEILISSHVYIFPSYSEGMPNSVLEAMACGLPVISTAVGGIKDFFKDGENGFLLQSNTPGSIAEAVTNIVNDKQLQINMTKVNHQSISRFLASRVARRLENIYENVTARTK